MKKKLIIVSKALFERDAKAFLEKTKDLFDGKIIRDKRSYDNGCGKFYPMFRVVRKEK